MGDAPENGNVCPQCPWRLANQGKRHPHGFYTKRNLQRLWNQLRGGGRPQGCHPTDPSHPDHVASGTPKNAKAQECAGSVIVLWRELDKAVQLGPPESRARNELHPDGMEAYLRDPANRRGLKRSGFQYLILGRMMAAGSSINPNPPLPQVTYEEMADEAIGLGAAAEPR